MLFVTLESETVDRSIGLAVSLLNLSSVISLTNISM